MAVLNNSNAISPSGYDINNSLRFRSSASGNLSRTPASAGNRQTWTLSVWVKRGNLGSQNVIFGAHPSDIAFMGFYTDNTFYYDVQPSTTRYRRTTAAVFRDPSAWYHIVFVADTTNATNTERLKVYINNVQYAFSTDLTATGYIPQNTQLNWNDNVIHRISAYASGSALFFDGYLTETNFIDGQALTPSSFGETDTTTGSWKPKAYTGTYGTNGFYLKFSDIATTSGSNAGLGKDFSGNGNYWNTNNISVTAGSTYDAMTDSPTLTSATVANYAVMNPLQTSSLATVTDANLTVKGNSASNSAASVATMQVPTGLYYAEFTITGSNAEYPVIGVVNTDTLLSNSNLLLYGSPGYYSGVGYQADGQKRITSLSAYGSTFTTGDVIGIAVDTTNGAVYFSKNNTWQNSGVPTSGASKTGAAYTYTAGSINLIMSVAPYNTSSGVNANFGQRPFSYTPPTGFVRLNTYNLPDSTIKKGNTVMNATLYTGAGGTSNITTLTFQPDLIWVKNRSNVVSHCWVDSNRGAPNQLGSDLTAAENSGGNDRTAYGGISTILSNGFTAVSGTDPTYKATNGSGQTYVAWYWKANQGTNTSNTSGTITSTVSVNTTAGFSIVTYTGTGANATVGHGLGVAPKMIICKSRTNAYEWIVWHTGLTSAAYYVNLNGTAAQASAPTLFQSTAPSSSVITLGTNITVNASGASQLIYAWAEIAGFSKFGSYTGNGSTDGTFVYTGFRPAFIMWKRTDTTSNWYIEDSKRLEYNSSLSPYEIYPNLSNAEGTNGSPILLSNGFKLVSSGSGYNASGGTYIYMAFAESPFKSSLAR